MTTEKTLINNQSENKHNHNFTEVSIIELLEEIQTTPREYWCNLLQIMRLFRESVTKNSQLSDTNVEEKNLLTQQHIALSELTQQWIEEGDESEQTETWEYLKQKLDENR
ncbi:hypothetical protein [Rivularia sp. UHCC 0363]|uniref:hypothetical protein n=1 Tax=Rivularia sp. UHCC 0363 TaxID=3110244 RepID=UPI002B1EEAAB|nr:hypothetical protein [Rivularia sp. UHCC 0363]MEA5598547.1 hypothetical protein [Rivularia sp. UHCC 0363]